jgi:hypothetical protein
MPTTPPDPILVRRARMARTAQTAQRLGYGMFGAAIVVFAIGMIGGFTALVAVLVVVALAIGSITLAPAIVLGYAVRAAEREERADPRAQRPAPGVRDEREGPSGGTGAGGPG